MAELPDYLTLLEGTELTEGDMIDGLFGPIVETIRQLPGGSAPVVLTIAAGSVTPTLGFHLIDTEAAAAADDLTHIAITNHPPGRILTIGQADPARVVTVRHGEGGSGEIYTIDGADLVLTGRTLRLRREVSGAWAEEARSGAVTPAMPFGQCLLSLVGGNLTLIRRDGRYLFAGGAFRTVPATPLTLAATGLSAGTLYYIYAHDDNGDGVLDVLEASTTAPAQDATHGHLIKTGAASRSLVGMARPIAGPAWVDQPAKRFVRSWFNRRGESLIGNPVSGVGTTSATYTELGAGNRVEWLSFSGETVELTFSGTQRNEYSSELTASAIGIDSLVPASPEARLNRDSYHHSGAFSTTLAWRDSSGGYHYAVPLGVTSSLGTGTWPAAIFGNGIASRLVGRIGGG